MGIACWFVYICVAYSFRRWSAISSFSEQYGEFNVLNGSRIKKIRMLSPQLGNFIRFCYFFLSVLIQISGRSEFTASEYWHWRRLANKTTAENWRYITKSNNVLPKPSVVFVVSLNCMRISIVRILRRNNILIVHNNFRIPKNKIEINRMEWNLINYYYCIVII